MIRRTKKTFRWHSSIGVSLLLQLRKTKNHCAIIIITITYILFSRAFVFFDEEYNSSSLFILIEPAVHTRINNGVVKYANQNMFEAPVRTVGTNRYAFVENNKISSNHIAAFWLFHCIIKRGLFLRKLEAQTRTFSPFWHDIII